MSKFQIVQTLQSLRFEALSFIKEVPPTYQWKRSSTLNTKERRNKLESHLISKAVVTGNATETKGDTNTTQVRPWIGLGP